MKDRRGFQVLEGRKNKSADHYDDQVVFQAKEARSERHSVGFGESPVGQKSMPRRRPKPT